MSGGTVPDPTYAVGDRVWYDGSEIGPGTVTRVDGATFYGDLDSGNKFITSWPYLTPLADHTP